MAGSGGREQGGRLLSCSPHGAGSAPGGAFAMNLSGLGRALYSKGNSPRCHTGPGTWGEMFCPGGDALNLDQ